MSEILKQSMSAKDYLIYGMLIMFTRVKKKIYLRSSNVANALQSVNASDATVNAEDALIHARRQRQHVEQVLEGRIHAL